MSRPAAVLGLSGTAYDMGAGLMGQELSLLDWEFIAWPHRASSAESGKGGFYPAAPHTTRHAGPHRAVHKQWSTRQLQV